MEDRIKKILLDLGANVCGIAHIDRFTGAPEGFHPRDIFPGCKSVVVFAVALPKGLTQIDSRLIYGHFNETCSCAEVDRITFMAAKEIERFGGGYTVPLPSDSPYEYWDAEKQEGRGLISMKHAAVLAGLGALGKSTLLLNKQYGNMLTIGAILTDMDIPSDPMAENICIKGCELCLKSCPAQALNGKQADQSRCRSNTSGTNARGFAIVKCNLCRTVYPMRFGRNDE